MLWLCGAGVVVGGGADSSVDPNSRARVRVVE